MQISGSVPVLIICNSDLRGPNESTHTYSLHKNINLDWAIPVNHSTTLHKTVTSEGGS